MEAGHLRTAARPHGRTAARPHGRAGARAHRGGGGGGAPSRWRLGGGGVPRFKFRPATSSRNFVTPSGGGGSLALRCSFFLRQRFSSSRPSLAGASSLLNTVEALPQAICLPGLPSKSSAFPVLLLSRRSGMCATFFLCAQLHHATSSRSGGGSLSLSLSLSLFLSR